MRLILAAIAALALAGCASSGVASGFSAPGAATHLSPQAAADFAHQIERDLATKDVRLAILFRTGEARDQLPDGISYTHGAFWVATPVTLASSRRSTGYAVYNLYHGDGKRLPMDRSYLHQDFPIDFVLPSAVDDVAVIIPTPDLQRRILQLIDSPAYRALHIAPYSLVSNPHDAKYQNCTEFMLDVIAAAAWNISDMSHIKARLKASFRPTVVKTSLVERLLAPIAASRIKTDDQADEIVTATYESLATFMKENGLLKETWILRRNGA